MIVLAVLIGRGAGLFGGGVPSAKLADDARLESPEPTPAPVPPVITPDAPTMVPKPVGAIGNATLATMAPDAASRGTGTATAAAADAPAAPAGELAQSMPAVDADRFASLLAMVQTRTSELQIGSAMAALEQLRALPLDGAQRATLVPAARELENALASACAGIVAALRQGEVLAAHREAVRLLADRQDLVEPALRLTLAPLATFANVLAIPTRNGSTWPLPKAITKDRLVRTQTGNGTQLLSGRVVDSRSDELTLRVQGPHGVTWPTVRAVECEPAEASPAEAIELGLVALHAGNGLLARLWLACANSRSGAEASDRAAQLAELLR